ncbi:hypothetical protein [Hymenobacter ruricola]|uniref:DUF4397 domain-containing protein n=1 Tax=Hymenobacter ruricola TaxID=2791023 RepID=A0ABS0I0A9_9BACT|nr:hypothetical protein [Hymenobacter ruricola]MBF9220221.1 hypothetical protein [Hymenobacter ruricola]
MRHFSFKTLLAALPLLGLLLGSCKKELDDYYAPVEDTGFASLGLPRVPLAPRYAPGETVPLYVSFTQTDQLRDISVFQVIGSKAYGTADSAAVGTFPASGTFNAAGAVQTQAIPYVVPVAANGLPVRVDVTFTFQNGSKRLRRFTYNIAQPITIKLGATPATYRNTLAGTAQTAGDIVGYSLVINETGVGTQPPVPTLPSPTAPLFKAVDSLTTFYRIGTGAPVRVGVVRNPSTGAANSRTVDVTIPAAAAGQAITYSFTAYGPVQAVTVTAPPLNVTTATPLATLRTGRISAGGNVTPDSLAFNLRTGQIEPAANPPAAKDLFVNSVSPTVTLSAANTTRYTKLTPAQIDRFYANATANTAGTLLYTNGLTAGLVSADLGTVAAGDVYAVRVRNAELGLLRILSVRPGTAGSTARVRFEYKTL